MLQVESALGPALQAAYTVMQDYGGKMLVFQNAVPSLGTAVPLEIVDHDIDRENPRGCIDGLDLSHPGIAPSSNAHAFCEKVLCAYGTIVKSMSAKRQFLAS